MVVYGRVMMGPRIVRPDDVTLPERSPEKEGLVGPTRVCNQLQRRICTEFMERDLLKGGPSSLILPSQNEMKLLQHHLAMMSSVNWKREVLGARCLAGLALRHSSATTGHLT